MGCVGASTGARTLDSRIGTLEPIGILSGEQVFCEHRIRLFLFRRLVLFGCIKHLFGREGNLTTVNELFHLVQVDADGLRESPVTGCCTVYSGY